ncbi:MAG: hypothetical protein KDB80_18015 [Planctomycetes bacterium]|nr:hypothetical protein [Planctomycetota bacterium]
MIWLAALGLAVAASAGLEVFWRSRGHRPTTNGTGTEVEPWVEARARATGDAFVLVGQSRAQAGFCGETFRQRCPDQEFVNLAVSGLPPLATLRDLAGDDDFHGTILCSVVPHVFEPSELDAQQEYVDAYHHRDALAGWLELDLAPWFRARMASLQPKLALPRVAIDLALRRPLPTPDYVTVNGDRSMVIDFSATDVERLRTWRIERTRRGLANRTIPSPARWAEDVRDIVPWIRAIEARGGRVIFVRFPTSGEHVAITEHYYPRADYWDRLADLTGVRTFHFADDPRTAHFVCPDTSHLDWSDAPRFTAALLDVLEPWLAGSSGDESAAPPRGR